MDFIIVTGLSGAGKSRAVDALEDIGFYCVDNIPPKLIPVFYTLCEQAKPEMKRVAIVTDTRGGDMFSSLFETLDALRQEQKKYKILFLDCSSDVLIHRYKETRRRHPLSDSFEGSITQSIHYEREVLRPVKEAADYLIDTTFLSPAQLKNRISALFLESSDLSLLVNCVSFGFKYGLPNEADLVFDVRCLPNPFYVEELKNLTGLDERFLSLIYYMLPLYRSEGKSQLFVGIGCTGGKHRSVALAQLLYNHLLEKGQRASVHHRDIKK